MRWRKGGRLFLTRLSALAAVEGIEGEPVRFEISDEKGEKSRTP